MVHREAREFAETEWRTEEQGRSFSSVLIGLDPTMEKYKQIERLRGELVGLMNAVAEMDEQAMTTRAIGEWALREVLAHIAGWTLVDTAIMRRLARSESPLPEGEEYGTGDTRNPGYARDAARKSAAEVVRELRVSFGEFVTAAESLPEGRFAVGRTAQRIVEESACAHIKEHRVEIEAYRATSGGYELLGNGSN